MLGIQSTTYHCHRSAISHGNESSQRICCCCFPWSVLPPAGGQQEAEAAFHAAMHAVFTVQVECHRHAQPHMGKKDGTLKWDMLEMWPMQASLLNHIFQLAA